MGSQTGDMQRGHSVYGDHVQIQFCGSWFSHSGIFCTFRAPDTPGSWLDGSGGATSRSACLPPCPRLRLLGKEGQRKENRRFSLAIQLLGLSYLFHALSRFGSSHYFELCSLLLPWLGSPSPLSAKCQSSHRMSSSASHPRWLCPRTRAAIADTQPGWGRAAGSFFNSLPIRNGC